MAKQERSTKAGASDADAAGSKTRRREAARHGRTISRLDRDLKDARDDLTRRQGQATKAAASVAKLEARRAELIAGGPTPGTAKAAPAKAAPARKAPPPAKATPTKAAPARKAPAAKATPAKAAPARKATAAAKTSAASTKAPATKGSGPATRARTSTGKAARPAASGSRTRRSPRTGAHGTGPSEA